MLMLSVVRSRATLIVQLLRCQGLAILSVGLEPGLRVMAPVFGLLALSAQPARLLLSPPKCLLLVR